MEKGLRILALDCATRTGWATNCAGARIEAGLVDFSPKRGESTGMRYVRFSTWLTEMLTQLRPEVVIYEQPPGHFAGANAAEVAYALTTRVQEICERQQVNYTSVNPTTLKWWVTGKGNATKDVMKAAATERYPDYCEAKDPGGDEADARHILAWQQAGMPEREKPAPKAKKAPRAGKVRVGR